MSDRTIELPDGGFNAIISQGPFRCETQDQPYGFGCLFFGVFGAIAVSLKIGLYIV